MGADLSLFWEEMNPCDHSVQIYAADTELIDALETFVGDGIRQGECVVVIATPAHRAALQRRLTAQRIDVWEAVATNRYIALDADAMLSSFMRGNWPDDQLFAFCANNLIGRARSDGRPVRAFGEMVALLWARGQAGATLRLEHLWHQLCQDQGFPLFCAYPRHGFTPESASTLSEIDATHDRILHGPGVRRRSPGHPRRPATIPR